MEAVRRAVERQDRRDRRRAVSAGQPAGGRGRTPAGPDTPGCILSQIEETTPAMTYVITQPCVGVKDASCVDVCPVDCIHAREEDEQYYIDPDECIDCGACEPACPVDAIFEEGGVPPEWREYIQINAEYFRR